MNPEPHERKSRILLRAADEIRARFGCHIEASGDFANSAVHGNCRVSYMCIVPQ